MYAQMAISVRLPNSAFPFPCTIDHEQDACEGNETKEVTHLSLTEEERVLWQRGGLPANKSDANKPTIGCISRKKMPGPHPREKGVKAPPRDRSKKFISPGSFHRTVLM